MTFNDWNEGTQIEPAIEYGYLYMNITVTYASRLKGTELNMNVIIRPPELAEKETPSSQPPWELYAAAAVVAFMAIGIVAITIYRRKRATADVARCGDSSLSEAGKP